MPWISALLMSAFLAGQDAAEEEAKKKISEFERSKGKTDADLRVALGNLAAVKHPKILRILEQYLKSGSDVIKSLAASLIGRYQDDKGAAEVLLGALNAEVGKATKSKNGDDVGHEVAVAILSALGQIGWKGSAEKLNGYFDHANDEVALAAVKAAAAIGSGESVDRLIRLLAVLEDIVIKPAPPPPPPKPIKPGSNPAPAGSGALDPSTRMRKEQEHKKTTLEPAVQAALRTITQESADKPAAEWTKWWNQNKSKFK